MTQFISGIGGRILCERHKWPSGESVGGFHKLTAADVSYLEAELATDNICETCRGEAKARVIT